MTNSPCRISGRHCCVDSLECPKSRQGRDGRTADAYKKEHVAFLDPVSVVPWTWLRQSRRQEDVERHAQWSLTVWCGHSKDPENTEEISFAEHLRACKERMTRYGWWGRGVDTRKRRSWPNILNEQHLNPRKSTRTWTPPQQYVRPTLTVVLLICSRFNIACRCC